MLQPQAFAGTQGQQGYQDGNSATSGVPAQQGPGSSAVGIQDYGPYRQRKRVLASTSNTLFTANTTLRLFSASMARVTSFKVRRQKEKQ
jgi:hypothetical protein